MQLNELYLWKKKDTILRKTLRRIGYEEGVALPGKTQHKVFIIKSVVLVHKYRSMEQNRKSKNYKWNFSI